MGRWCEVGVEAVALRFGEMAEGGVGPARLGVRAGCLVCERVGGDSPLSRSDDCFSDGS